MAAPGRSARDRRLLNSSVRCLCPVESFWIARPRVLPLPSTRNCQSHAAPPAWHKDPHQRSLWDQSTFRVRLFWPANNTYEFPRKIKCPLGSNSAVQLSIARCSNGKFTNGQGRLKSTRSRPFCNLPLQWHVPLVRPTPPRKIPAKIQRLFPNSCESPVQSF